MGIHNSSILSTERRVVNHNTFKQNMKAFMTACAVLASSANADPQLFGNLVNLDQTVRHPGLIQPYNDVPLNHVSYAHTFNAPHPLGPVMATVPSYSVAALPNQPLHQEGGRAGDTLRNQVQGGEPRRRIGTRGSDQ